MTNKDKKSKSNNTPLLDKVNNPDDLKFLKIEDLDQLSFELRSDMIDIVSKTPTCRAPARPPRAARAHRAPPRG